MGCNKSRKKWTGARIKIEEPITLKKLVDDYLNTPYDCGYTDKKVDSKKGHEIYLDSLTTIEDFICGEPGNKISGPYKINGHQRFFRFPKRQNKIPDVKAIIEKEIQNNYSSFEDLFRHVKNMDLYGFGDTTVYDFSLRYGWHLNPRIEPDKKVYLHSKPKEAAKILRNKNYLTKDFRNTILLEDFPVEIKNSGMSAADIEHFLCIYIEYINKLPNRNQDLL